MTEAWLHCVDRKSEFVVVYMGELLVTSGDPELDAARALVALGVTGKLQVYDARTDRLRSTVDIERAAKLRSAPPGFYSYAEAAQEAQAGPQVELQDAKAA
jgi:hypothetical protein